MAIGDKVGEDTLKAFNEVTLPKLEALVERLESLLVTDVNGLLDRLNGTRIQIHIPPSGELQQ